MIDRRSWALLAIASAEGKPLSPVQLQKSLFLFGRNAPEVPANFYEFEPYHYGPFSKQVYSDTQELARLGHVEFVQGRGGWAEYRATPAGLRAADVAAQQAPPRAVEYLRSVVAWTRTLSFRDLVSSIYQAYPEQRAKSVFVKS